MDFFANLTTDQWIAVAGVVVPVIAAILAWKFGMLGKLLAGKKEAAPMVVKLETPPQPVLERPVDTVVLTIETYEAQVRTRIAEAQASWEKAEGAEKEQLGQQIGELQGRLENIEPAFEAAKARIAELEQLLEREGNQIGAERLERAEKALAAGDFDEADALLAEISAEENLAVQRKARAEFGRGQIAEEQVRWHDAAKHYGEAARLHGSYPHLYAARKMCWLSGAYPAAAQFGDRLLEVAGTEFGIGSEPSRVFRRA